MYFKSNIKIILLFISIINTRTLNVDFISEEPWLYGHSWGGSTFGHSIDIGSGFIGESQLDQYDVIDIDIYLSHEIDSISNAWVYSSNDSNSVLGFGIFPGTVYDVSDPYNPRRLNIIFF